MYSTWCIGSVVALATLSVRAESSGVLSAEDEAAAFQAAGYSIKNGHWRSECGADDLNPSYSPGQLEQHRKLAPERADLEQSAEFLDATPARTSRSDRRITHPKRKA